MDKVMKKMVEGDAADRAVEVAPRKVYVVNYKETDADLDTESGVCDYGYTNEADAIAQCWKLSDGKMNELMEDFDDGDVYRDSSENGDWQCVQVHGVETCGYTYWVSMVTVL